MFSADALML